MECFRKWKKVEILFKGPLSNASDPVKCNYIIYWSGEIGMELVDKREIERKIHDANKNNINRYFELFEEHIAPKSNALIAIVELKTLPRFHESGRPPYQSTLIGQRGRVSRGGHVEQSTKRHYNQWFGL